MWFFIQTQIWNLSFGKISPKRIANANKPLIFDARGSSPSSAGRAVARNSKVHQDDHQENTSVHRENIFCSPRKHFCSYMKLNLEKKNWTKIWEWLKRKTCKKLHAKSQQDKNHLYRLGFVTYHLVCAPIDHYVCHVCKRASLSSSQ